MDSESFILVFFSLPHHLLVRPSLWRFTRFCGLLLSREKNLCNRNRKTRKASKRKGKKLNWIKWIRVGAWTDDSGFCKSRHVHSYNHQLFSQAEFFSPTPIHRLLCVLFFLSSAGCTSSLCVYLKLAIKVNKCMMMGFGPFRLRCKLFRCLSIMYSNFMTESLETFVFSISSHFFPPSVCASLRFLKSCLFVDGHVLVRCFFCVFHYEIFIYFDAKRKT